MASEVDKAALEKLLESGNCDKCLKFFDGMPEKLRRDYFPVVKAFWSRIRKVKLIEDPPGTYTWNPLDPISRVAYFATATGADILKAKRSGYPDEGYDFSILADRRPEWIEQWIENLLGESSYWRHWRLIRQLILAGLIKKPTNPRYYLGMISALTGRRNETKLVDELQREPDLLKEDIWKLFEYDGDGENSLANTERFNSSWIDALVTLSSEGKVPRAKLLEACIGALEGDFNHYRAKWYFEMFDRLEPTDKEINKVAQRILALLGASAPNVSSWALARVDKLAASGTFSTPAMCHALAPIMRARAKGTLLSALKLLERQAAASPQEASLIATTAAQALAHDVTDVQKATLKLLASISSPDDLQVRRAVESHQATLAASVRGLATNWLSSSSQPGASTNLSAESDTASKKKTSPTKPTRGSSVKAELPKLSKQLTSLYAMDALRNNQQQNVLAIPAAIFDGTDLQRLHRAACLVPLANVEELIDLCARVIEDGSLVDDAERCIDGLARLVGSEAADLERLSAPLLKRVRKLLSKGCIPFCGADPANDVLGLFYAFCTGQLIEPKIKGREVRIQFEGSEHCHFNANLTKPIGFLSTHCQVVARRIAAGVACQLLSVPTHAGGWIDPRELAKRANAWTGPEPHVQDVILSILRLAPEHRSAALKSLKGNSSEWLQAIRYALGEEKIKIGGNAALWVAAARARSPWSDDEPVKKQHPGLGPDAAEAAKLTVPSKVSKRGQITFQEGGFNTAPAIPKKTDPLIVTVSMFASQKIGTEYSYELGGFAGRTVGTVRWTAMIWPLARESYFASSAIQCFSNLDWWEAEWQNRSMLEPLIDSGTPLRTAGLFFLTSMLAAKEPGESGLATDIAIRAIEDGRLGSDNFGQALGQLLVSNMIKPGRWQKTLSEVARASQVHAAVVQLALQSCFVDPKQELPKEAGKLLELLYELSLELGVPITSPACRAWLSSGVATGKSIKIAKELLAIAESPASKAAVQTLLEQAELQRATAAAQQIALS